MPEIAEDDVGEHTSRCSTGEDTSCVHYTRMVLTPLSTPPLHHRGLVARRCRVLLYARFSLGMRHLHHRATLCNGLHRIVAQEEVAGSSPVGHPPHQAAVDKRGGRGEGAE